MEKLKDDALVGNSVRLVSEYDFPYPEGFDGSAALVARWMQKPRTTFRG